MQIYKNILITRFFCKEINFLYLAISFLINLLITGGDNANIHFNDQIIARSFKTNERQGKNR